MRTKVQIASVNPTVLWICLREVVLDVPSLLLAQSHHGTNWSSSSLQIWCTCVFDCAADWIDCSCTWCAFI